MLVRTFHSFSPTRTLVSCYVPTHNRADLLLTRALPSIRAQTYTNLEIIVACHGCTDGTARLVRGLNDPRIRVLNVPRKQTYPPTAENHWLAGPVVPANAALKAVRGDWIVRLDDDDELLPDHVEVLLRAAQDGGYEFISGAYERERNGVREILSDDGENPPAGGVQTWMYRSYLRLFKYNSQCYRKPWNRVNDSDLVDRFRKAGVRMGHIDRVVARVLPRPGETTVGLQAYQRDQEATERRLAF